MTEEILIFAIFNLIVSIFSGISGGGIGLVAAPFLIALGTNPLTAITTSKVNGLGMAIGAITRYHREKILDFKTQIKFMVIGGVGAAIGSGLLVKFSSNEEAIQDFLGYVILIVGLPLLYSKDLGLETIKRSTRFKKVGYVAIFANAVIASALSGITTLHLIILMYFFGMTAINASVAKRSMQLVVQSISLIILGFAGFIDYRLAIVALFTSIFGAYIGANIAIKKGNKFVINFFAILSAVLALKLILS